LLATASDSRRPWWTVAARTARAADFGSEERREHVKEMREEQAKLKERAIGIRCSGGNQFCRRFEFDGDEQEEEERRERLPALAFQGKERMERWPAPS
jgi:hypothetical protein